jgi:hypothetical protein
VWEGAGTEERAWHVGGELGAAYNGRGKDFHFILG